jgi:hypothetical protein
MRMLAVQAVVSTLAFGADVPRTRGDHERGGGSLYFNQNGYTADGKEMVYTTPDAFAAEAEER